MMQMMENNSPEIRKVNKCYHTQDTQGTTGPEKRFKMKILLLWILI